LSDILLLLVSALLCGMEGEESIVDFGREQSVWLTKYGSFRNGIPSHDTVRRVMKLLDYEAFGECYVQWSASVYAYTGRDLIPIDGKRICGSASEGKNGDHIVSAYSHSTHLCLGQVCTKEKSNEITAIPELLKLLDIKGKIVSTDAMGCQKNIATNIIDGQGDYLLAVKDNQPKLKRNIEETTRFTKPEETDIEEDFGHGRITGRTCSVYRNMDFIENKDEWKNLACIIKIDSTRYIKKNGQATSETRFYISSANLSASDFNAYVKAHWAIENNLHWSLDVVFNEDRCKRRTGNGARNFNIIRKIALSMFERDNGDLSDIGKKRRQMLALQNLTFREKLLKLF